jgi:dGTPase
MKSVDSRGRQHPEKEHPYRSAFQRDRESIIHTTAFRRLKYKTQVFVYYEGESYRTRLTHTMEVAQIARAIARALGLNEDLTEAIALAHDLGHPPFGHAGEYTLRELMKDYGGFEHNRQSLRVVEVLEQCESSRQFPGLNLTWEVREGIVKHETRYDSPSGVHNFEPTKMATLEAQVVAAADVIAYRNHDLDDGLRGGFIVPDQLEAEGIELWGEAQRAVRGDVTSKWIRRRFISFLINRQVTDLVKATSLRLEDEKIQVVEDVRNFGELLVTFSEEMAHWDLQLGEFLHKCLYHHYRVERMHRKAERCIRDLFEAFLDAPSQLPPHVRKYLAKGRIHRVICGYIAGMTDRSALSEHKKLFNLEERA